MVRARTVRRRLGDWCDGERANLEERRLAGVGRDDALAETAERVFGDWLPRRFARERDAPVFGVLRAGGAGRAEGQRLAAVLELEMRRHPHQIAKILRRLHLDFAQA